MNVREATIYLAAAAVCQSAPKMKTICLTNERKFQTFFFPLKTVFKAKVVLKTVESQSKGRKRMVCKMLRLNSL